MSATRQPEDTQGDTQAIVLSVDVEDYFHVEAFSDVVDRSTWDQYASRVEANTRRLLDLFDEFRAKGTFFVLGWVAERYPALVREIAARGHELACHSYWHRLIFKLTPEEFRQDLCRAKEVIEQAAGVSISGFRAPSYSVTRQSMWALDTLVQCGFKYDSSIFPIRHDVYGIPDAPRLPFSVSTSSGSLVEYPITTFRFGRANLPVGGGGYLRICPLWYTRLGFASAKRDGLTRIVYVHPWEVDPKQPRINGRVRSRFRHYTNLDKTYNRLRLLLGDYNFKSFCDVSASNVMPLMKTSGAAD